MPGEAPNGYLLEPTKWPKGSQGLKRGLEIALQAMHSADPMTILAQHGQQ